MPKVIGQLIAPALSSAPSSPVEGQIFENTVDHQFYFYDGTVWQPMSFGTGRAHHGMERTASDRYRLYAHMGSERYIAWEIAQITGLPGGFADPWMLERVFISSPMVSKHHSDASVVLTGASWSASQSAGAAYGGSYKFATTAGDKAVFTSPANTTRLGIRQPVSSNGGVAKVLIDGSATRANLLPTAQELVNKGRLTSLGALSATDRVVDFYPLATSYPSTSTDFDRSLGVADGLTPGVHTMELQCTASQNVAATSNRLYIAGFCSATDTTKREDYNTALLAQLRVQSEYRSATEFAYTIDIGGSAPFLGTIHGYETNFTVDTIVDGTSRELSVGELLWGNTVEWRRTSELRHPNLGSGTGKLAEMDMSYRCGGEGWTNNRALFVILHRENWFNAATAKASYPMMLPVDGYQFITGRKIDPVSTDYTLTANDGTQYGKGTLAEGVQFDWPADRFGSPYGKGVRATLQLRNRAVSVNDFLIGASQNVFVEDRIPVDANNGDLSKGYIARSTDAATQAIAVGDVWSSEARYEYSLF